MEKVWQMKEVKKEKEFLEKSEGNREGGTALECLGEEWRRLKT